MYGDMYIINPDALLKSINDLKSGKSHAIKISNKDFEIKQVTTQPLKGFELHESFPNCCDGHSELFKLASDYYEKFPDCCSGHRNLPKAAWFNKSNYDYVPYKITSTLVYTFDCIERSKNNENWYHEITDYIEITKNSFGQTPYGFGCGVGLDLYMHNVKINVEKSIEIEDHKRAKLLEFISRFYQAPNSVVDIDLNLLIGTYKKWLKDFPFQLSLFSHMKDFFTNQIPIIEKREQPNLYSGLVSFTVKTQEGLIQFLVETTETILSEINTLTLDSKGLLTNPQVIHLELIKANRQIEINQIKQKFNANSNQYIKILKQWFAGEKKYLKEITEVMNSKPQLTQSEIKVTNADKLKINISQFGFFDLPKIKAFTVQKQVELIKIISDSNNLSYQIAMFNFLDFIEHIETNYLPTKYKLYKEISKWFNSDKEGRAVKGYINSLAKKNNVGERYNANNHKQKVQKDYQALK